MTGVKAEAGNKPRGEVEGLARGLMVRAGQKEGSWVILFDYERQGF